eukprot:5840806-Pyramimonas_sp.AAC.1
MMLLLLLLMMMMMMMRMTTMGRGRRGRRRLVRRELLEACRELGPNGLAHGVASWARKGPSQKLGGIALMLLMAMIAL